MDDERDDVRPRGTVELECSKCRWCTWFDPMSRTVEAAKSSPYVCTGCIACGKDGDACLDCNGPLAHEPFRKCTCSVCNLAK